MRSGSLANRSTTPHKNFENDNNGDSNRASTEAKTLSNTAKFIEISDNNIEKA